jgi:hypothetical protein
VNEMILSELEGSRRTVQGFTTGFLNFARNDCRYRESDGV